MITVEKIMQLTCKPYPTAEQLDGLSKQSFAVSKQKRKLKKLKSTVAKTSIVGLCFHCQRRVNALEGISQMRCECGDFLQTKYSCYAFAPIKWHLPNTFGRSNLTSGSGCRNTSGRRANRTTGKRMKDCPKCDLTMTITWRWEVADGSKCFVCKDTAWLSQRRMMLNVGKGVAIPFNIILCQSCADAVILKK